jgi:erythromycin esterase-like protein
MFDPTLPDFSDGILTRSLRQAVRPLSGAAGDYDPLIELIGDAHFVLIGEASHGTHEFYRERAQITKRLIREKGFNAVAVEADWPDAYRVNRFVRGRGDDPDAVDALGGFQRFPTWMWRNADVLDFVGWLREHNDAIRPGMSKVGFYGLDLYSLHTSMAAVITYLDTVDPEAAKHARHRYACFDLYGDDTQAYGFATALELGRTCEDEVITQLIDLRRHAGEYALRDGRLAEDDYFYTEQNARLVRDAEQYYRTMYREALFHSAGPKRFLLTLRDDRLPGLDEPRLERAIGVIYHPETERASHYFHASLPAQFDAVLHFDQTRAVEPLERTANCHDTEVPETFPSGV